MSKSYDGAGKIICRTFELIIIVNPVRFMFNLMTIKSKNAPCSLAYFLKIHFKWSISKSSSKKLQHNFPTHHIQKYRRAINKIRMLILQLSTVETHLQFHRNRAQTDFLPVTCLWWFPMLHQKSCSCLQAIPKAAVIPTILTRLRSKMKQQNVQH